MWEAACDKDLEIVLAGSINAAGFLAAVYIRYTVACFHAYF